MEVVLSIVIANYNYGRFIANAIESITKQCEDPISHKGSIVLPVSGFPNYGVELIICDAASKDNSVSVIRSYSSVISWWCSEKDSGQSEAFNKGFSHASGRYLTWLNADEQYIDGSFKALVRKILRGDYPEWITGNFLEFDVQSRKISYISWGPHWQPWFLKKQRIGVSVFGPSSFVRKDVFDRIGPIDPELHYTMDLDYWTRLTMAGLRQTRLNCLCWAFGLHADSKSTGDIVSLGDNSPGHMENVSRYKKYGHTYKYNFKNPWYCVWMVSRLLDGSLFIRFIKRLLIIGKLYDLNLRKWSKCK